MRDSGGRKNIGARILGVDMADPRNVAISVREVNDAPSFRAVNVTTAALFKDSSLLVFAYNVSTGAGDESGQTLSWSFTYTQPQTFASRPNLYVDRDEHGNLIGVMNITTATIGQVTFRVTLVDNGASASVRGDDSDSDAQTFLMNIYPVNGAPSFDPLPLVLMYENAPPQTIRNFAQNISKGPAFPWEAAQTLFYTVEHVAVLSSPWSAEKLNLTFTVSPDDNSAEFRVNPYVYGEFNITVKVRKCVCILFSRNIGENTRVYFLAYMHVYMPWDNSAEFRVNSPYSVCHVQ